MLDLFIPILTCYQTINVNVYKNRTELQMSNRLAPLTISSSVPLTQLCTNPLTTFSFRLYKANVANTEFRPVLAQFPISVTASLVVYESDLAVPSTQTFLTIQKQNAQAQYIKFMINGVEALQIEIQTVVVPESLDPVPVKKNYTSLIVGVVLGVAALVTIIILFACCVKKQKPQDFYFDAYQPVETVDFAIESSKSRTLINELKINKLLKTIDIYHPSRFVNKLLERNGEEIRAKVNAELGSNWSSTAQIKANPSKLREFEDDFGDYELVDNLKSALRKERNIISDLNGSRVFSEGKMRDKEIDKQTELSQLQMMASKSVLGVESTVEEEDIVKEVVPNKLLNYLLGGDLDLREAKKKVQRYDGDQTKTLYAKLGIKFQ
ncbi:Adenovirus_E3 region protein CR2 [Hexamita inflata]|uniref:Adenovirus E3 region protein CR2 n=1 Tax=Hexamita inflata TaxID=28002 RepID=A0AA86PXW6_9EUKA|nr:Adenovirus E3 region protein CR2 [Hexamita inflata]